jgi:hypothetical protein
MDTIHRQRIEQLCVALESGEYEQERNALRRGDRYCCLGVACHLVDPSRWLSTDAMRYVPVYWYVNPGVDVSQYDELARDKDGGRPAGVDTYLPRDIMEWYGFAGVDPLVNYPCGCTSSEDKTPDLDCQVCYGEGILKRSLSELNDNFAWSFTKIAQALRLTYLTD